MNICGLQGRREAALHWDAAAHAKEDSSFEEAVSFELLRFWRHCSKGLEDALRGFKYESPALWCSEGEGSEERDSFGWGIFSCSLVIAKGHENGCLLWHQTGILLM